MAMVIMLLEYGAKLKGLRKGFSPTYLFQQVSTPGIEEFSEPQPKRQAFLMGTFSRQLIFMRKDVQIPCTTVASNNSFLYENLRTSLRKS